MVQVMEVATGVAPGALVKMTPTMFVPDAGAAAQLVIYRLVNRPVLGKTCSAREKVVVPVEE
jgi:hypothetical protein